jgi:hypothetical protein
MGDVKKKFIIGVRLTEAERDYIEAMADKQGVSIGEFIRVAVQRQGAMEPGDEFLTQIQERLKASLLDVVMKEVRAKKESRGRKKRA